MADTNFSLWNPTAANQENDATYAADAQRSGGAVSGVFASALANKVFYQPSIWVRAFALSLVGKGFSPKDGTTPYTADSSSNAAATALKTILDNVLTTADAPVPARDVVQHVNTGNITRNTISTLVSGALTVNTVVRITSTFKITSQGAGNTLVGFTLNGNTNFQDFYSFATAAIGDYKLEVLVTGNGSTFGTVTVTATLLGPDQVSNPSVVPLRILVGNTPAISVAAGLTFVLQSKSANNADSQTFRASVMEIYP